MCLLEWEKDPSEVYILLNYSKHKRNFQLWLCCNMSCCLFIRTSPDLNLCISCSVAQFTLAVSTLLLLKFLSLSARQRENNSTRDGKEESISS